MPFALKKILGALLLLLVFSFVVFVALDLSSGSVLSGIYGDSVQSANPLLKARLLENLGLDRPLLVRYLEWLGRILRGDLGVSLASGERVIDILKEGLPYTLVLGLTSFALSFIFALVLGTIGAYFKDSWLDKTIIYTTLGFFSVPSFWLGLVAIMLFSVLLGWLPSSGVGEIGATPNFSDLARHMLLPVCVLTLSHLAIYTRLVRSVVLDTLQEPFVLSYQAWGVSALKRFYLVLRFCFLPIVGYFASNAGAIVGGTYVVESVFSIGGIGQSTINALLHKDYPLALSIIMLSAFFVVGLNVVVELLARWLNPKW
ncbi:Dipeptide ABC transporter permease DppB [Helicobacter sp. NHP19-012]|uniref:Dipeptide ABC transporter permease DppB n=1 Tax=Helicobacter gastrofelis TaxID=2849642 RepID=A0ABN6I7L6_9HELI|nr:ABC transporter permease [Helicobacter sp. NHP19-012]BCZ19535.1 Dipeptide ABC transporter permease DppB [Helicobacter sp. NHP19-012]